MNKSSALLEEGVEYQFYSSFSSIWKKKKNKYSFNVVLFSYVQSMK